MKINNQKPLVSVIMNCFNGEKYLSESVNSVINQKYQNWELIFWDNMSTDSSKEILGNFVDNRIKYFSSKKHLKLGQARNEAIKKSKGALIAFLDTDDIWLPDKLKKQVPEFNNTEVGLVICDTVFFNEKGLNKQYYKNNKPPEGYVSEHLISNYFISLETLVIRRKALASLEYWFDKNFNVIEEFDLLIRLSFNWKLSYVDKILAKWRIHKESWTWQYNHLFPAEKSIMIKKYINEIEGFSQNYSREIKILQEQIDLELAIIDWENNKQKSARKIIRKYSKKYLKWKILLCLTYLPIWIFKFIQKLRGNIVPY